ncbi:hypothetical protein ACQEVF_16290 [Nonomuraea polychroma]|uniref:hypothetical protein n=1 Tax=Nonomuraea polychroma TaxID=46176 RepID=UPI003D8F1108
MEDLNGVIAVILPSSTESASAYMSGGETQLYPDSFTDEMEDDYYTLTVNFTLNDEENEKGLGKCMRFRIEAGHDAFLRDPEYYSWEDLFSPPEPIKGVAAKTRFDANGRSYEARACRWTHETYSTSIMFRDTIGGMYARESFAALYRAPGLYIKLENDPDDIPNKNFKCDTTLASIPLGSRIEDVYPKPAIERMLTWEGCNYVPKTALVIDIQKEKDSNRLLFVSGALLTASIFFLERFLNGLAQKSKRKF